MIDLPFNGVGSCSRFAAFHDLAPAGTLCRQGATVCEWDPPVYVNDLDRANYCGGEFLAVARHSPSSSFLALMWGRAIMLRYLNRHPPRS